MVNKDFQYLGVAVEYHPLQDLNVSSQSRLATNVIVYLSILQALTRKTKIDIIVFPESTLTANGISDSKDLLEFSTEVPNHLHEVSPCFHLGTFPAFFQQLSCAAVAFDTYLVANLIERVSCATDSLVSQLIDTCSSDGLYYYNTNVAFNRNGTVIARYRKSNLQKPVYYPFNINTSIIHTDFGIKFGILTGYDILFNHLSLSVLKNAGVTHFVLPSRWYSELPFLTALQIYQQWAYENDVVLLVAGANEPFDSVGGSGIFQGRSGPNTYGMEEQGGSNIHMANVLKSRVVYSQQDFNATVFDSSAMKTDDFYLRFDNLSNYNSQILNVTTQTQINITLTSGCRNEQLRCNFAVSVDFSKYKLNNSRPHYYYRALAYSGVKSFYKYAIGGVEICAIVACLNEELISCGKRFNSYPLIQWPTTFKSIIIKANFKLDKNRMQYPNSLLSNIRPLPIHDFEWSHRTSLKRSIVQRIFKLKRPQKRLMTFSIFGRDFNRDCNFTSERIGCKDYGCNSTNSIKFNWFSIIVMYILLIK